VDGLVDRDASAWPIETGGVQHRAAEPDRGNTHAVDEHLYGDGHVLIGHHRRDRRRPTWTAIGDGPPFDHEADSGQFADERADRAAGQPGAGDQLRARHRAVEVELAQDRGQVGAAHRFAAQPCR
jgi:hypothetical protein